jgi:hypothetical protein
MKEVAADLLLAEPVRGSVEVVSQLPHGAELSLLSALTQTSDLEILEHPLTERCGHVLVLWQRVEKASARNLETRPRESPGSCKSAGIPVTTDLGQATLSEDDSSCRASGLLEPRAAADPERRDGFRASQGSSGGWVR